VNVIDTGARVLLATTNAMHPQVPPPDDWRELERYVARFSRDYLHDPHASLYGRQGQGQHGLDVLARDRRPEGSSRLWAFQTKNYLARSLKPSDLEDMVKLLQGFPQWKDIDTFVVVTTAPVSTLVQDKARAFRDQLRIEFQVWSWEHFSDLLIEHCGAGPWLAQADRTRLRQQYCAKLRNELRQAAPLYPLPFRLPEAPDISLEDVLVPQVLRLAPQPGGLSAERRGEGGTRNQADPSSPPARYEGSLADWLSQAETKPLVLVCAPMGAGKTVAILSTASELAERAARADTAPLPLRVPATQLVGAQLDAVIPRHHFDGLPQLWADPLSTWILLVDALDEVEEREQQAVLQEMTALHARRPIAAVAVTCRISHLHPRLLPEATRVELPPWREADYLEFSTRWESAQKGRPRAVPAPATGPADASMRANPLCSTLLALHGPGHEGAGSGRARLFRRLVDGLFRRWAEGRSAGTWEQLQEAFERVALDALEQGGHPVPRQVLEAALEQVIGGPAVEPAIDAAELQFGLIRQVAGDTWEFPLRSIAEYLAAGALLRRSDEEIVRAAGKPWAGEVTRLTLDRCWEIAPERALGLIRRFVEDAIADAGDAFLRRTLVAAQAARDRPRASTPIAEVLAERLFVWVTDETSAWRRRRVGEEVRSLAFDGGPVWRALWSKLTPLLLARGDRASWLAEREQGNAEAWIGRLLEQDAAVRAVALSRLAEWKEYPEVQEILIWEIQDEGYAIESHAWRRPALEAAAVLRDVPHGKGMLELLQAILAFGNWLTSEAAAIALLPGEADTGLVLKTLKELVSRNLAPPAAFEAVEDHLRAPEGRAWLEQFWPEALGPGFAAPQKLPVSLAGNSSFPPSSHLVRQDLFWAISPALRRKEERDVLAVLPPWNLDLIQAICSAAEVTPEAGIEMLEKGGSMFIPVIAQEALGRAALRHPDIGRALVKRWRDEVDIRVPSSFPGVAMDPLAARGDPDAVQVYAEWLPHNPFMMPLVPAWHPPSRGTLRQPPVMAAALAAARDSWDHATVAKPQPDGQVSKLHPTALALRLRGLWPTWQEDQAIRDGLIAWSQEEDLERFNVSLQAWMDGEFPEEVALRLQERILDVNRWPSQSSFVPFHLPIWLSAASRARILRQIEPMLKWIVSVEQPSSLLHEATSYLILLHPEDGGLLAAHAASLRPFFSDHEWGMLPEEAERLLSAAPAAWAKACLEALRTGDRAATLPFLRMARRLWSHLSDPSLRHELVEATRRLTDHGLPWMSMDIRRPCVRLRDAAEDLLFLMGEPVPL